MNNPNEPTITLEEPIIHSDDSHLKATGLREELWNHPSRVWFRSTRVGSPISSTVDNGVEVLRTGYEELANSDALGTIGAAALVGSVIVSQTLDRYRIIIQKAPPRAVDLMVNMEFNEKSSLASGALVAGAFACWNFIAGEILNRGLERFPNTTEKFVNNFPRVTKAAQSAISHKEVSRWSQGLDVPSTHPEAEEKEIAYPNESESTALKDKLTRLTNSAKEKMRVAFGSKDIKEHAGRGLLGTALGSTIYMGVAATENIPRKKRTQINYEVSRDAGVFLFGFVSGISELVRRAVIGGSPQRAETIISWAGGTANWNWFAAGIIALTSGLNYSARNKVAVDENPNPADKSS